MPRIEWVSMAGMAQSNIFQLHKLVLFAFGVVIFLVVYLIQRIRNK
jgi:hypothetical protein